MGYTGRKFGCTQQPHFMGYKSYDWDEYVRTNGVSESGTVGARRPSRTEDHPGAFLEGWLVV